MSTLKSIIKRIPILSWFVRWAYNILRINNTKYKLYILEQRVNKLSSAHSKLYSAHSKLYSAHSKLSIEHLELKNKFHNQEQFAYDLVRKQIVSQVIYFDQKIENFLRNTNKLDTQTSKNIISSLKQSFLDEYYVAFENKFRGTREEILNNSKEYLKFVPRALSCKSQSSRPKSLDIGCGRAEWVELMQNEGYESYGIDLNPYIIEVGQLHNIKNLQAIDAFEYFKQTPDNNFELVTAFHIIEHLPFEKLVDFLLEIKRIAKPDATILLETPNPKNSSVAQYCFYFDLTHLNPLPCESIEFLVEYLGFKEIQTIFLHPTPNITPHKSAAQDYLIVTKNDDSVGKITPLLLKKQSSKKTIFIDKSALRIHDGNSGIQRVVKKQIQYLTELCMDNYNIEPVYLKQHLDNKVEYYYDKLDAPVYLKKGDILYIPDLSYKNIDKAVDLGLYQHYKYQGIKIVFLVHDILPITHEQFFKHKNAKQVHEKYLINISNYADLIIATTKVGKSEIENYLKSQNKVIPEIVALHLGSDFSISSINPNTQIPVSNSSIGFLMVGTLEPRKAHKQVIKAFDLLWEKSTSNQPLTLTIIGKKGWLVEETITLIEEHPLLNKNLFYIEKANDQELQSYYEKADVIIVASYAEGFGLPLVEAIYNKKQIIARDIPVFREIAADYPIYFKDTVDPKDIMKSIKSIIHNQDQAKISLTNNITDCISWKEHTKLLLNIFQNLK